MELVIAKDWAGNKKGSKVTITDKSVIEKGYELGVFEKPKKEAKETHIRCADCMNITGVIETAEKNNKLLEKVIQDIEGNTKLLNDVLNQVKKNNKLQQLQLLKGVEANELQRIVSIVGEE